LHLRQRPPTRDSNFEIEEESDIEKMVKKHLEIIILSIIRTQPMCGRDIVKQVFRQYKVFVNQSSVYNVLYSLEEKKILEASTIKGDLRSKVYIPTEKGNEKINEMLDEFISSMEYFIVTLKEEVNTKKRQ
jgi:DNA-binding PadR family transcriptional regulator